MDHMICAISYDRFLHRMVNKRGWVFPMVIWPAFRMGQYIIWLISYELFDMIDIIYMIGFIFFMLHINGQFYIHYVSYHKV